MPRLQFVLLAAAVISTSWAQVGDLVLTLTAKEAVTLYVDGIVLNLPNDRNVSLTDNVTVTQTSRLLAFQSVNFASGCPGIIASITGDYFLSNSSWKCFDISEGETWTDIGFDDSQWPNATEHKPNIEGTGGECDNLPYVASISANAFWVWMESTSEDIIYCRAYLPVCSSSPCKNGGTCNINEVDQCTCVAGFTGTYCETEVDECASGPCLNGATCEDLLNAFQCSCIAGFTGVRCETDVYECGSTPCLNNGTCEDQINGYQCVCPANYTGLSCETKVDYCSSLPCQNNATCVSDSDEGSGGGGDYTCTCADGFTGSNCETVLTVTLIVTADRSLSVLFIDDIEYELDLTSSFNWSHPDQIAIPALSSLIALRASNAFDANCSGILGSIVDADVVTSAAWKCSTDNSPGWFRRDFNDSHWPQAVIYDSNTPPFLCQHRHQIDDISSSANWIWTSNTSVSTNCRVHLDDPCITVPCLNGGTCSSAPGGGYSCSCDQQFTGIKCETELPVTLIITADRSLYVLFIDDIEYELDLTSTFNWSHSDQIAIPAFSSLIALRAANSFEANCSGILGSIVGADVVTSAEWKCSTDNSPGWFRRDFNDSHWPQAVIYDSNTPPFLCQHRHQIDDISSSANWIWTSNTSVSTNCRVHLDDPCITIPCLNGGTCSSAPGGGYSCSCDQQFTGINCETVLTVTLIITADRSLNVLFVDDIEYELDLTSSFNWSHSDQIAIPAFSSLIALRAANSFEANCSGILGSIVDADVVTSAEWKCSTDNSPGWFRRDFNDSHWPQAIIYDSNTPPFLCQYRHQIDDISSSANWIWTSDMSVSTNCRAHLAERN